jgi:hypothetical protein
MLQFGRLFRMQPFAELFADFTQFVKPPFDLVERIRSRVADVLIPQLNDHLGEPTNHSHQVDRVIFARRQTIGWHLSALLLYSCHVAIQMIVLTASRDSIVRSSEGQLSCPSGCYVGPAIGSLARVIPMYTNFATGQPSGASSSVDFSISDESSSSALSS